ncbi:MAG: bifunctional DNA primase/polymerase [Planctomycetota bacterium]|nr:bifunctional DNA primase/polymerase [Planctomycetota bacterium]
MTDLLADALGYAARGMSIIPTKGKRPAIRSWKPYQSRRAGAEEVTEWYANGDADGVAVICGPVSGNLTCRDFDDMGAYNRWALSHMDLAGTLPTVRTARGRHVYFVSEIHAIRKLGDGELRGAGFSLLPHSRHPDGTVYEWVNPLPDGTMPSIDPIAAGLAEGVTERQSRYRDTEAIGNVIEGDSSVSPSLCINSDSLQERIENAILTTLPLREGERNRRIFDLARALKAIPELAESEPKALRATVRKWYELARPALSGEHGWDDVWADFIYAWPRVKWPKGHGPMSQILALVDEAELPAAAMQYDAPETRRLVAVCRELQRAAGDGPFYLSVRKAAEILGRDLMTAHRRLNLLENDGILDAAEKGSPKTGKATRWRYTAPD